MLATQCQQEWALWKGLLCVAGLLTGTDTLHAAARGDAGAGSAARHSCAALWGHSAALRSTCCIPPPNHPQAGASLDGKRTEVEQAAMLCTAVFEGNLPLLRRLLHAGVRVDSGDYGE